jgi:hypothetical protein
MDAVGSGLMSTLQVAFEFGSRHGCVVVRDSESEGDVSNAPRDSLWFFDRSSGILAVQPAVEGPVRCEVWVGTPEDPLPLGVADEVFEIAGALQVEDPAGVITVALAWVRGRRRLVVLVDDGQFPTRVQFVVDPD